MQIRCFILFLAALVLRAAGAQPRVPAEAEPLVAVGVDGVMRWTSTGEEVALFGVNYSTPFACAFFLPYWFDGPALPPSSLELSRVEAVEFSIDGKSGRNLRDEAHGYEVERVMLVKQAHE